MKTSSSLKDPKETSNTQNMKLSKKLSLQLSLQITGLRCTVALEAEKEQINI